MNPEARPNARLFALIALLAACSLWSLAERTPAQTCTIFTVSHGDTVLFANNEDWHSPHPVIGFYPASPGEFGSGHVGFRHSNGSIEFGGALNDQGLAWDVNGVPRAPLNPHPERPYAHATDNYLSTITKKAATVEDAVQLARDFDFGDSMSLQFHVADASGDAVVIGPGPDGELAFTRKAAGDGHLVSTNFNLTNPDNATRCWRYDTATSMLDELSFSRQLSLGYVGEILDAVHLNTLTSYTLYSNIFDLKNRRVHLSYLAQYDEWVELTLTDELAKGERVVEMSDLFSPDTVDAGQAAYRQFEMRFTAAKAAVVVAILVIIALGAAFVVRKTRARRRAQAPGRGSAAVE